MVPRWHSPGDAIHAGERSSPKPFSAKVLPRRWINFLEEQAVRDEFAAAELAETKFVFGERAESETTAVKSVRRLKALWERAAIESSSWPPKRPCLNGDLLEHERESISRLRRSLRENPGQGLLWSELARSYLISGHDEKARDAMSCAIQISGNSTYIRRSASRLYLHVEDKQQALNVVRRHPNAARDPRIVAAEIALASVSERPSKLAHLAAKLISDASYRSGHQSELSAALATVEMTNGKHKHARALFSRSLTSASENTLAQVQWAMERDPKIVIPPEAWRTPNAYEADALAARLRCDWDAVLDSTEKWLADEPFAIRPAALGSFAMATADQCLRSYRLSTWALSANQNHPGLLNNRAVAAAYLNRLDDAYEDISAAFKSGAREPFMVATLGLIAYRFGDGDLGEKCYGTAISRFAQMKNAPSVLLASLFWLRELIRIGAPGIADDIAYFRKMTTRLYHGQTEPEVETLMRILEIEVSQGQFSAPRMIGVRHGKLWEIFESSGADRESLSLRNKFLEQLE